MVFNKSINQQYPEIFTGVVDSMYIGFRNILHYLFALFSCDFQFYSRRSQLEMNNVF